MRPLARVLLVLACLAPLAADALDSDLGAASNGGGCYPTGIHAALFDMVTLVNPEWSPVVDGTVVDSDPILVHATVTGMHGDTGGDFPSTHVRSDVNYFLKVDPGDEGFVATGNGDNLEFEWEAGALPAWAWAGAGDHLVALGRWIFDCGHPDPHAGQCSQHTATACVIDDDCRKPACPTCSAGETCAGAHFGYSSELHPPYAEAVIRSGHGAVIGKGPERAAPVTRVDVFASGDAGGAGDRCVLTHQADLSTIFMTDCYPLSQPVATLNRRDLEFDVPLPPKPAGSVLAMRRNEYPAPGGVAARLLVTPFPDDPVPHVHAKLFLTGDPKNPAAAPPTGYAGTLFAGWANDPTPLTHLRVDVTGVVVRNALQRVVPIADPVKAWQLQVGVNGRWTELTGLDSVSTGDVIPEQVVIDDWLPANGALHIEMDGAARECITNMFGKSLGTDISELGLSVGIECLNSTEHSPGRVDVTYPGPDFGTGVAGRASYETTSTGGEGGHCSVTTSEQCVIDDDCPGEACVTTGSAVAVRYRIKKLP